MSPVKHSPRSCIRHMRMTLSMSVSGNSSRRKKAISASRQLCSATLSRRPLLVSQWRRVSFSRSAVCRMSSSLLGSIE